MSFIQTYSGHLFDFNRDDNVMTWVDTAHACSQICRFGGHTKRFYSVAEHMVNVCDVVDGVFKPWALIHDKPEAYIGDVVSPLKRLMPEYKERDTRLLKQIADSYNLGWPMPEEVHIADMRMLATEERALMTYQYVTDWEPYDIEIVGLEPAKAKELYLERVFQFCVK